MALLKNKLENLTQGRKKVYIIPSQAGIKFIFINFTLFLISLSYANNMALLITFIMLSYLILQMLETHKTIQESKIENIFINDDFLESTNSVLCQFKNLLTKVEASNIKLDIICENDIVLKTSTPSIFENSKVSFPLILTKRGKYEVKCLKIYTYGSSKLFYVWRYFPAKNKFFIYPKKAFHQVKDQQVDQSKPVNFADVEFEQHIPYSKGLNSKRIDWKVYARKDLLYWKKHIDYQNPITEINFNKIQGGKEERLQKMSFTIDNLFKNSSSWKLILPNKIIKSSQGAKHYKESLEAISEF